MSELTQRPILLVFGGKLNMSRELRVSTAKGGSLELRACGTQRTEIAIDQIVTLKVVKTLSKKLYYKDFSLPNLFYPIKDLIDQP